MQNLQLQWIKYLNFCGYFGLRALPAEEETLVLFAQYLTRRLKLADFITNYVSSVKTLHVLVRAEVGTFKGIALSLTLKRFKEKFNLCVKREGSNYTPNLGGHQETPKFSSFAC